MKIQTFSIVAGSQACNARCPFCISKMTVENNVALKEPEVNWPNFSKACRLAQISGVTTAMITSKGEPTLFPEQITKYLRSMHRFDFPIIELQTNGIPMAQKWATYEPHLKEWHTLGLSTIAISIVHFDPAKNREIYVPYAKEYIDLHDLIVKLHSLGFSVRLTCTMLGGYIDSAERLEGLIGFAREHKVEQLSVRPVNKPTKVNRDQMTYDWSVKHALSKEQIDDIVEFFKMSSSKRKVTLLMTLMHGAEVYDVDGQNVCLTDCLTRDPSTDDLRQLIFFPDGHLRYDWEYEGAIIL